MPTLEFESPLIKFNDVMDTIVNNDLHLIWVYYNEAGDSVVIKTFVPYEGLREYLLELASALGSPTEVSIVDVENPEKTVHEAFLITVKHATEEYPVFLLFEYFDNRFYPSAITVGLHPECPEELVDAVLNLTVGRVDIGQAKVVKSTTTKTAKFIYLKPDLESFPRVYQAITV